MDPVTALLSRSATIDWLTCLLAFTSGLITSIGPCMAPRYFAVVGFASLRGRTAWFRVLSFAMGIVVAYVLLAFTGSLLVRAMGASPVIYWLLAAVLLASGVRELGMAEASHCCAPQASSNGGGFFLGLLSSMVISPCCAPILVALGGLGGGGNGIVGIAAIVVAFTLGHLAPIITAAFAARVITAALRRYQGAIATVNAGVLIALGLYYAVLA